MELGDAFAALGMRQTGKTTLVTALYKMMMNTYTEACGYVIDSNVAGDFTGWSGAYSGLDCPIIRPSRTGRQVIWQPGRDDYDAYERFFQRLFDFCMQSRVPAVVFIDELSSLGQGSHDYYARILKRGRRRSGFPGITLFSVSQEFAQKASVPRQTFSQVTHLARFYVQHPYDVREINKIMNLPQNIQPEHEHGFWHVRLDRPPVRPRYYDSIERLHLW